MPEPEASATTLADISDLVREGYHAAVTEDTERFGATTGSLFKVSSEAVTGDGKTFQFETAPGDSVRKTRSMLGPVASPDRMTVEKFKVRFNQDSSSTNDFARFTGSARVTHWDMKNAGQGVGYDLVKRVIRNLRQSFTESLAIARNTPASARIALVNGTIKKNDVPFYADAAATATNAAGARLKIDNGSFAYIRDGTRVDIWDATNSVWSCRNVMVRGKNYGDKSIGLQFISGDDTTRNSSGDLADIADNDEIYFAGEKGEGVYSIEAYMSTPTSGETFIGGINRLSDDFAFMRPILTRKGESAAVVSVDHIDELADAMYFRQEGKQTMVALCPIDLHNKLRKVYSEAGMVPLSYDANSMANYGANLGSVGLTYQHPAFGVVKFLSDPLTMPGQITMLDISTWLQLYYDKLGAEFLSGSDTGIWSRMGDGSTDGSRGFVYEAQAYQVNCDICLAPNRNGRALNLSAA